MAVIATSEFILELLISVPSDQYLSFIKEELTKLVTKLREDLDEFAD